MPISSEIDDPLCLIRVTVHEATRHGTRYANFETIVEDPRVRQRFGLPRDLTRVGALRA